jgi:hypothetical protein
VSKGARQLAIARVDLPSRNGFVGRGETQCGDRQVDAGTALAMIAAMDSGMQRQPLPRHRYCKRLQRTVRAGGPGSPQCGVAGEILAAKGVTGLSTVARRPMGPNERGPEPA